MEDKEIGRKQKKSSDEKKLSKKSAFFNFFAKKEKKPDKNTELVQETVEERKKYERSNLLGYFWKNMRQGKYTAMKIPEILEDLRLFRDAKESALEKYKAYESVIMASTDTVEYYILLVFSCIIASLGLIQNSAAVIIGAMVVAPLMPPVLGFSAGVLWGSFGAIWEGLTTLIKGAILAVLISALISFFIPGIIITPEIQIRTAPTFFDIIIAVCCGFVGAYAYINKKIANVIPGIAISVALMPPLCSIGICLGLRQWDGALGASFLLLINLLGISFAAVILFAIIHLHPQEENAKESGKAVTRAAGQIFLSIVLLSFLSAPLVLFTAKELQGNILQGKVQFIIEDTWPEAEIETLKIKEKQTGLFIECLLLFPENTETQELNIKEIENRIEKISGKKNRFLLYSLFPHVENAKE